MLIRHPSAPAEGHTVLQLLTQTLLLNWLDSCFPELSEMMWDAWQEQRHLKVVAVFVTLVFILIVLCTVSLFKRIAIAVAVLKVH